jgi:hypothetical protein
VYYTLLDLLYVLKNHVPTPVVFPAVPVIFDPAGLAVGGDLSEGGGLAVFLVATP